MNVTEDSFARSDKILKALYLDTLPQDAWVFMARSLIAQEIELAVLAAYTDCLGISKDFTGQGVLIADLIQKRLDPPAQ